MMHKKWIALLCSAALLAAFPGASPLADAAMRGDIATVRSLLSEGADVDGTQGDGMTALHWAAERGDVAMTTLLLEAGADVQPVTRIGDYTPLHLAAKSGQAGTLTALLVAGSDPDVRSTAGGSTALHFAAGAGDTAAIAALLDHGADVNAGESTLGQTPLIFAASYNRLKAVKLLMERGANVSTRTKLSNPSVVSGITRAAQRARDETLTAIRDGAEARAVGYSPKEIQGAIEAARQTVRDEIQLEEEEKVEEEPDLDKITFGRSGDYGGLTPLLHATRQGHTEVVLALLDGHAALEQTGTGDEVSPLLMAIANGHFDLAVLLLDRGADANFTSASGNNPLYATVDAHWAPKSTARPRQRAYEQQETGYLELMTHLLRVGADPNLRLKASPPYEPRGYSGATPFWRAAYATDVTAMRLLVAHGADHTIATRSSGSRNRSSRGSQRGRNIIVQQDETQRGGTRRGGTRRGTRGGTRGAQTGLIQLGGAQGRGTGRGNRGQTPPVAEPNRQARPGIYAIHAASGLGYGQGFAAHSHRHAPDAWMTTMRYLVEELGHEVTSIDSSGYSALHNAASRGDNDMIFYLVSKGADPTVISGRGQSTADMANGPSQRLQIFPETRDLLIALGSQLRGPPKR